MRFLITGLPRVRTAWLAALFSNDLVRCFHDSVHHGGPEKMLEKVKACNYAHVGVLDPAAACVYPRLALATFERWPIVVIRRNEEDSKTGLENWAQAPLNNWEELEKNHAWFRQQAGSRLLWSDFDDLDHYETVAEIFRICTGLSLDKDRFDLFNTLKIEQHYAKAAQAAQLLKH